MQQGDLYRAYFLHQCQNHPELQHQDAAKVFGMIDIEDSFGDFRLGAKEKGYLLRLITYTYGVGLSTHETLKAYTGGYIIAKYFQPRTGGEEEYWAAMDDTERINDELIEKIIVDSRNGHPLWYNSLDSRQDFSVQPIRLTGDGSYCGWRTIFSWRSYWRDCITSPDAPEWADGGVNPHEL